MTASMITLTCVVEDRVILPFKNEHGLSIWIESPAGKVLFDTGSSGSALIHNLRCLNLNPAELDAVVLSHAHQDHTGGLLTLLPHLPQGTPLYAHPTLFEGHYSDHGRGPEHTDLQTLAVQALAQVTLRLSKQPQEIVPGIWTTGEITERPYPEGRSAHHTMLVDEKHVPEPYADDLSLVIESSQGLFLLCGCCHAGLRNTLAHVHCHWKQPVIGFGGGTHLLGASPERIRQTVEALTAAREPEMVWLGHCSGVSFIRAMQSAVGEEHFRRCSIGTEIQLA